MRFIQTLLNIDYKEYNDRKKDSEIPHLDGYILDDAYMSQKRAAVIVCPGGGYQHTSIREGEPIALQYSAAGMQSFVLWYSVAPAVYPIALLQLAKSVLLIREHAEEWNIDPEKIFISGFSAGAHLAGCMACLWNDIFLSDVLECSSEMLRPNGNLMFYPVVTSGEFAHKGSFESLLDGLEESLWDKLSLEKAAGTQNPPTFLWHTFTDAAVPVENSLLYISALHKAGVSCEMHIYREGHHGLALANEETATEDEESVLPDVGTWMDLSIRWIKGITKGGGTGV